MVPRFSVVMSCKVCPGVCACSFTAYCAVRNLPRHVTSPRLWAPGTALTSASPAFDVEPLRCRRRLLRR
eukprot:8002169-Alexandrium_andersonii.AAC.1